MNMSSAFNQTFGRRIFIAPIVSFLFLCGVKSAALSQVTSAAEIINALKPRPASRSLKVEDIPIPKIDLTINFEFNSARLSSDSQAQLGELSVALTSPELVEYNFSIIGHTDAVGGDAYNMRLSKQRADSVVRYLASRYGIAANRLLADGKGKTRLKSPDQPDSGVNRRVEIINVSR
jgi:outer membrane protein OmpA-like peptidoglycan-associated protein